jgi:hypothetical protein
MIYKLVLKIMPPFAPRRMYSRGIDFNPIHIQISCFIIYKRRDNILSQSILEITVNLRYLLFYAIT